MRRAASRPRLRAPSVRAMEVTLRTVEQSLDDLARTGSAEVTFVRHAEDVTPIDFIEGLERRAIAMGFAAASIGALEDNPFDVLEDVVQVIARNVRTSVASRAKRGIVGLLDAYANKRGAGLDALVEALGRGDLASDLGRLARAYLAAKAATKAESARIEAWLSGVEIARGALEEEGVRALSARTAKRALSDLTRLTVALGHRGTVVIVHGADMLASLPAGRRQAAYTVLRELVDNADGGRGMVSAAIFVVGSRALYDGPKSMASLVPLSQRAGMWPPPSSLPRPHQPLYEIDLDAALPLSDPEVRPIRDRAAAPLRAIIRASHGLPPIETTNDGSVGHARIEKAIDDLFEHTRAQGSVFALLTGDYGAGKTHFMLHLAARALADHRPVFRLSLERLDMDLGHPERHLRRLLDSASLPSTNGDSATPLDRAAAWTSSDSKLKALIAALEAIASAESAADECARRALQLVRRSTAVGAALASYLNATDLERRSVSASSRRDAYARLLLWLELLDRLDGSSGAVLLIDEAENLYRGGATRAERRTALRSLSFYCGGALPSACVVLAITPDALKELREEAPTLLDDVAGQRTLLEWEDATMLCRRLKKTKPLPVPSFEPKHCLELASRLRATHEAARGKLTDHGWGAFVASAVREGVTPRELTQRLVDRLERRFWLGNGR